MAKTDAVRFRVPRHAPLPVVQVHLDGTGPYAFVIDTGASSSVISPRVAREARLPAARKHARAVGAGGSVSAALSVVGSVRLGHVEARHLQVAVVDLAHLERAIGVRIDGVLGYNFLRRYRVTIDYPRRQLLLEPGRVTSERVARRPPTSRRRRER